MSMNVLNETDKHSYSVPTIQLIATTSDLTCVDLVIIHRIVDGIHSSNAANDLDI